MPRPNPTACAFSPAGSPTLRARSTTFPLTVDNGARQVRDQNIAVFSGAGVVLQQVPLFRQLSDRVTLFLRDAAEPSGEQKKRLAALDVEIVRPRVE